VPSPTGAADTDHRVQWTYLPIFEPSGAVGGVFNPVYDVTARVVSERRMIAMRELATRLSAARTFAQLLVDGCEVLSQLELDFPYAAAYRVQKEAYTGLLRSLPACLEPADGRQTRMMHLPARRLSCKRLSVSRSTRPRRQCALS
jgi:hypothetical protein